MGRWPSLGIGPGRKPERPAVRSAGKPLSDVSKTVNVSRIACWVLRGSFLTRGGALAVLLATFSLLTPHSSLLAQSPEQRDSLDRFRDSLEQATDTLTLTQLER